MPYWLRGALRTGLARRPIEATHPVNLLRLQLVRERLEDARHVSLLVWLGEPGGVALGSRMKYANTAATQSGSGAACW